MKLGYKSKIALSILIFLLASGALIFFIIIPETNKIKKNWMETAAQAAQVEKNYSTGQSLKKVADNLKIVEPRLGEMERALIKKSAATEFFGSLEEIAKKNKVAIIKNLPVSETAFGGFYLRIPLQIESQGNFKNQIDFLTELESLNYYINFKSLILTNAFPFQASATSSAKILDMQLLANTYWQE
jgi:Tfp pilus assembly protein PilO